MLIHQSPSLPLCRYHHAQTHTQSFPKGNLAILQLQANESYAQSPWQTYCGLREYQATLRNSECYET